MIVNGWNTKTSWDGGKVHVLGEGAPPNKMPAHDFPGYYDLPWRPIGLEGNPPPAIHDGDVMEMKDGFFRVVVTDNHPVCYGIFRRS